jgi:pyruvate dehydrogenase E2 component (dihydrolipoamide acetyltransferase)
MPIEIIVPRLGWSMEEGAFVAWLKQDGEFVRAGEALFSIEGDKAVQEIEAIDSGILRIAANCPKPGAPVRVGDVLGHLFSAAESAPVHKPASASQAVAASSAPAAPQRVIVPAPVIPAQPPAVSSVSSVPAISPRAVRLAAELGVDWTTLTGTGRTGRIRERDVRAAASSTTRSTEAAMKNNERRQSR